MVLVYLESPFAGDVPTNVEYARRAMRDSVLRGEAPFASHLLYTQEGILDDDLPDERKLGMEAGFAWGKLAAATVVYTDYGLSTGMMAGIERASQQGRSVVFRKIGKNPKDEL